MMILQRNFLNVMNVFDIIGPVMIGPSSSHTAGASRAGLVARRLLGESPVKAKITLYGSFAKTYAGHGADKAIIGGILGYDSGDVRIRDSFSYAKKENLEFEFVISDEEAQHPNTAKIELQGADGGAVCVTVCSVGGGVVNVVNIDGGDVMFSAEYDTTVIFNEDKAGVIAQISSVFAEFGINIAFMRAFRKYEGKDAIMVIETDQGVDEELTEKLRSLNNIRKVITIPPLSV